MSTNKEISRYLIVSPIVGATDFSVYYLSKLALSINISKGISFVCAGILGYLFNKHWTFSQHKTSYPEMGRYWITEPVLLGYNVTANWTILHFWPRGFLLALVIASVSTAVISFVLKKWWVFKSP